MAQRQMTMGLLSVLALVVGVGLTSAQERRDDRGRNDLDHKFVRNAASGGLAEVKLGEMAKESASSADVKKFAEQMVNEHTKANKELTELARKAGIEVPTEMQAAERAAVEKLSKLRGAEFDRGYMKQQVDAHKEAVALFEEMSRNGQNKELKAWAEKTLPTLRDHLKHALKVAGQDRSEK